MDTAFIVFHVLLLCGGNVVQFPGLHFFTACSVLFRLRSHSLTWFCNYNQVRGPFRSELYDGIYWTMEKIWNFIV